MFYFEWISARRSLPVGWDLRRAGWILLEAESTAVGGVQTLGLLDGASGLERWRLRPRPHMRQSLVVLGCVGSLARGWLINSGFGDALGPDAGLAELDSRSRRLLEGRDMLPRIRRIGQLELDLFHRDARWGKRWLAMHPREFSLLWRLAESPGRRVSRKRLLQDVWRLKHDPETNSLEVHVSRLRSRLALVGLQQIIVTDPGGGYRLESDRVPLLFTRRQTALDSLPLMVEHAAKAGGTGKRIAS